MSGFRIGSGFIGSPGIQTSVAGEEILPECKICYKLSMINDNACTISINGQTPIYLRAMQGFNHDEVDVLIRSFKIVEAGVTFNFIGAYQ